MKSTLLKCYLAKSGDEKNKLVLTNNSLIIVFKGSVEEFRYDEIKSLRITVKKLIIPLVLGGIGTTFSMLALPMGWYHYQLNLFSIFMFFGLMYYGFIGKDALVVEVKMHQHLFLLSANKWVVGEFVTFVKERIWKISTPLGDHIYHLADRSDWEKQSMSYNYVHHSLKTEGFIHCSDRWALQETYEKYFKASGRLMLLVINPKWVLEEIKKEGVADRNRSFPHVYGPINKSAIVWAVEINGVPGLQNVLDSFD